MNWVRLAFRVKTSKQAIGELILFSENMAKKSREDQKAFLRGSLSIFRKGLLFNYLVDQDDSGFGNGFSFENLLPLFMRTTSLKYTTRSSQHMRILKETVILRLFFLTRL